VVQKIRLQSAQQDARKAATTALSKINRGDVRRAIVVRTKQQTQRKDGSIVRFDDNACVLIDDKGEPLGTRIMGICPFLVVDLIWVGVVAKELAKNVQANKIMSLAPKVI
jgi:ribosomal protein L14